MKRLTKTNLSFPMLTTLLLLLTGSVAQIAFAFDYPEPGDFARGGKTWSENCSRCHNMRNTTDLRDDQWITTVFHMRVRAGLTGQETRDVLTFLQTSNVKVKNASVQTTAMLPASDATAAAGKLTYESNCVACHGADGKGTLPGVPDFTDKKGRLTKPNKELLSNIINGYQSPGSVMAMPPKGGDSALSPADASAVLDYIKKMFSR